MDTTIIKIKDLKGFGDIQIPFLLTKGSQKPTLTLISISDLDENLEILVNKLTTEDYEEKYLRLLERLCHVRRFNEPNENLLQEIDEVALKLNKDSKLLNYMSAFEDNYPNKEQKKPKEHNHQEDNVEVARTDLPIPEDTSEVKLEKTEQVKIIEKIKETQTVVFDITPRLKNDGSLRDEIIQLSYKGLVKPIDINCAKDILGRWWDLDALNEKIQYGDILVEALLTEEYPPYLSNADKEELEYINVKFMEIKGRKPFETS